MAASWRAAETVAPSLIKIGFGPKLYIEYVARLALAAIKGAVKVAGTATVAQTLALRISSATLMLD
ncbi:MAG: hypothetical protein EAZ73_25405 [Oscillatoriales cyanobacterium]|nr:MAG: hypothetical protein EAZ83_24100 [Oscillatoriales cyanobacterium]TAE94162.1 MAG: hypothetical protein EAZ79_24260 [Oscillatoriales cyanobacterium]TAF16163.1 MAG: hypothetical protein EAZ73_25405 [Oscillatoriales cyanobacterium]TAF37965.1 MAG: hypothetical protein EAZ69_06125 [Oscillatoriales cyanobacterium]